MAQVDVDLAALTTAATRCAKVLGFNSTQAMATTSDRSGNPSASLIPLLDFLDTVTNPGHQSQRASTSHKA